MKPLTFEKWIDENEISIELAENGANYEMDFDIEQELENRYEKYLKSRITYTFPKSLDFIPMGRYFKDLGYPETKEGIGHLCDIGERIQIDEGISDPEILVARVLEAVA